MKTLKAVSISDNDLSTWEMSKELAREQGISMSEWILRAMFNELHEQLRTKRKSQSRRAPQ